jgi:hypothetical protein
VQSRLSLWTSSPSSRWPLPAEYEPFQCGRPGQEIAEPSQKEVPVPEKRPSIKNDKQYEALKDRGMSKQRAARIANAPNASSNGGKGSGSGGDPKQGRTTAQHKAAGRKGGKTTAAKS